MKFRWGFQWHKVGSGAVLFLGGAGVSAALWFGDRRVNVGAVLATVVGLFAMINGLMGEDGVW